MSLKIIHKFGHNDDVGTTYVPVAVGGIYRTPQYNSATTLRIKAGGNANDTLAGSGARVIHLNGLDENGAEVFEDLDTAGASASSSTTTTFTRLFRAYVEESGTYASASAGSHSADIVIENTAGTEDWATIKVNGFAESQTGICVYTVPLGCVAYIKQVFVSVESTKAASLLLFQRQGADKIAAPYDAMRVLMEFHGVTREESFKPQLPIGPFPEHTDLGLMAKVPSGTSEVDGDLEILVMPETESSGDTAFLRTL